MVLVGLLLARYRIDIQYVDLSTLVRAHSSLDPCQAISMGPSGNLSGGQRFLALDTGKMIVWNRWKEFPMPLAVIDRVNLLGHAKCSLLVFTDHHG